MLLHEVIHCMYQLILYPHVANIMCIVQLGVDLNPL